MASSFAVDHAYDLAPALLLNVLTDTAYVEEKMVAIGFGDVAAVYDGPTLVITRSTEPPLPGFAKAVLGGTQKVVEHQDWTAGDAPSGTFRAAAAGTPVSITGTFLIEAAEAGSMLRIRGSVAAKVPLVGGKIADLVAGQCAKTLADEYAFTKTWITNQ